MSAKLDLSSLPPEVRQKVEAGLARLSPETRRKWEEQGSPLLARLVSGLAGATAIVPPAAAAAGPVAFAAGFRLAHARTSVAHRDRERVAAARGLAGAGVDPPHAALGPLQRHHRARRSSGRRAEGAAGRRRGGRAVLALFLKAQATAGRSGGTPAASASK